VPLAFPAGAPFAQGLPGGASSLNETHGDWTVTCASAGETVSCAMTQTQVNGENRQRVLAIELAAAEGGGVAGRLVLPFGLALESGVRLGIDDSAPLPALRFSTCLPGGCIVPLAFDPSVLAALDVGTAIAISATASDSGNEVKLSISLSGFRSALARLTQLVPEPSGG
jgi:invasion protein IalB